MIDQRDRPDRSTKQAIDLDLGLPDSYEPVPNVPCPTCGHIMPRAPLVQPPDGPNSPLYPPPP